MKVYGLILVAAIILFQSNLILCRPKIVCYWASESIYRRAAGRHSISKIDPKLCTHLVYAYGNVGPKGIIAANLNALEDEQMGYDEFVNLKYKNPNLKVLISIGGPSEQSAIFSEMAKSTKNRKHFILSALNLISNYDFDGLDLDWIYPTLLGGNSKDRDNFVLLLKELRQHFVKNYNKLILLSAAVSGDLKIIKEAYDIKSMCKYLNFVNLKTYDMHYENVTSLSAPLKRIKGDFIERSYVGKVIDYFKENGCPRQKLILGIPTYGRTYTLKQIQKNNLNTPVVGPGPKGPYTEIEGYLGYNEICLYQRRQLGWELILLKWKAQVYAKRGNFWLSYDSPLTVRIKVRYVQRNNLGGIMFSAIDTDDFEGTCSAIKYPMLRAAKRAFNRKLIEEDFE